MTYMLGIDVGGTGTKAAIVNTETGELNTPKYKYATPKPSTPSNVVGVIEKLIKDTGWDGNDFGCGIPGIVKNQTCLSAANIDDEWINLDLEPFFKDQIDYDVTFINDADAAGLAEMRFGKGRGRNGTIILITLGTGIGAGLFCDGKLVPNAEFGHLLYKESVFEHYASNGARKNKNLSWSEWGKELDTYLNHLNLLLSPDMIIIGGGVSKHFKHYEPFLSVGTEVVPALLQNNAGIIGAALCAKEARE